MIKIENLSVGYSCKAVLSGINAEIISGTFSVMIGRNGAGKSTLLRTMAGLIDILAGNIVYDGKNLSSMTVQEKSRMLAFVNTEKIRIAGFRCYDLVALGRSPYTDWIGNLTPKDEDMVDYALSVSGMADFKYRKMDSMSDGECQMASIARAVAQDTPVILLDEPTAFLDYPNRHKIFNLMKRLASDSGKTVVCSSHDIEAAVKYADRFIIVEDSRVSFSPVDPAAFNPDIYRWQTGGSIRK